MACKYIYKGITYNSKEEFINQVINPQFLSDKKVRRVMELQSDLFQKGRKHLLLTETLKKGYKFTTDKGNFEVTEANHNYIQYKKIGEEKEYTINTDKFQKLIKEKTGKDITPLHSNENEFLQLLNKDDNWVTFFIKSIIQDSAKKGYEKVLFPKGETAARIEGHETLANEITKINSELEYLKGENYSKIIDKLEDIPDNKFVGLGDAGDTFLYKKENNIWKYAYPDEPTVFYIPHQSNVLGDYLRGIGINQPEKIKQLEQRKQELKSQGIEKLKPIEAFYEIKVGNILEKQFGKPVINENDKIIWGHPAIGKTYTLEQNPNLFIDWDVEFNANRDKWIADKTNTVKDTKEYKAARNEYMINYENHPDYIKFVTSEWNRVKEKINKEGKKLLASPHMLLNLFPNDFDKIINISDNTFIKRNIDRNAGDETNSRLWKEGINKTLSKIDKSKIITTDKYLEELLNEGVKTITDEYGNQWREITIDLERDLKSILLYTEEEYQKALKGHDFIKDNYLKNQSTTTTNTLIDNIISSEKIEGSYARLLAYLKQVGGTENFKVEYVNVDTAAKDLNRSLEEAAKAWGYYNDQTRILKLVDRPTSPLKFQRVFTHEYMHALASTIIEDQTRGYGDYFKEALFQAKKYAGNDNFYGLIDIHEFVAELMSNADFAKFLETVPPVDDKKYKNLLSEIFDILLEMFGLVNKDYNLYKQAFAVLSQALDDAQTEKIFNEINNSSIDNIARDLENLNITNDVINYLYENSNNNTEKHIFANEVKIMVDIMKPYHTSEEIIETLNCL